MKVLHLVHGSPHLDAGAGGTERYAAAVASAQGAPVFTRDPTRVDGELKQGPHPGLWALGLPNPADFRGTWSRPDADAALSTVIEAEEPDLVHVHHLAHLGFGTAQAALDTGIPVLLTLHDYHLVCARGQLVDRDLNRCDGPSVERCGRCVSEHLRANPRWQDLGRLAAAIGLRSQAREALSHWKPGPAERMRIQARLDAGRAILGRVERVLSPSRHLGRRLEDLGWLDPGRWHHQDLPLVAPLRPAPEPGSGPVRFLFVGHLIPTKGVLVLLDAFARLGRGELVLRGPLVPFDGQPQWSDQVLHRIDETPGASWGGPFDDTERQGVYDRADVLVVPSTWEENSPLVVREALATGLRVVFSDLGGLAELDPEGRRVRPDDVEALAAALALEAEQGRERRVPRDFSLDQHLRALETHYRAACEGRLSRER